MKQFFFFFLSAFIAITFNSCSSDDVDDTGIMKDGQYIYAMQYEGAAPQYGDDTSSRGAKNWQNGAKIYLRLISGSNTILCTATYSGSSWTLATNTALSGSGRCEAVCIENAISTTSTSVSMNATSAVYSGSGTYSLSGTTLTVSASLSPKYGRIRLKGTSGTSVSLTGLTTCTAYNIRTGAFTPSTDTVATTIQSTGYTPYLYGSLSGTTLTTNGYTMTCPSTMMKAGDSGWLNYPTSTSHTGWTYDSRGGSTWAHE